MIIDAQAGSLVCWDIGRRHVPVCWTVWDASEWLSRIPFCAPVFPIASFPAAATIKFCLLSCRFKKPAFLDRDLNEGLDQIWVHTMS